MKTANSEYSSPPRAEPLHVRRALIGSRDGAFERVVVVD